jgi:hypothetical protein
MELTVCNALCLSLLAFPAACFVGWKLGNLSAKWFTPQDIGTHKFKGALCGVALLALFMVTSVTYQDDCNKEDTVARMIPVPEKVQTVLASACSCENNGNQLATTK